MQWDDARTIYPHQWLLIEAIDAHTKNRNGFWIELPLSIPFPIWTAMQSYLVLHRGITGSRVVCIPHRPRGIGNSRTALAGHSRVKEAAAQGHGIARQREVGLPAGWACDEIISVGTESAPDTS